MAYTKTTWVNGETPINADNLNKIENQLETLTNLQDQLLDIFYPIGSYYETSDTSFDPNVTWGGTWVKDSKGRVTVALDDSDTDFNTISKTGGEKTHKLTIDEMPSHNHGLYTDTQPGDRIDSWGVATNVKGSPLYANSQRMSFTGNDLPHNNVQPFVVVVRWHRTA